MHKKHNIVQSFGFAINGIKTAIILNRNLKLHIISATLVLILCVVFGLSVPEISLIIVLILLVVASEMINTAIEEVVNLVTKDYRQEAKNAKDIAAGMVLVVAFGAFIIGLFIFLPHILETLNNLF